MVLWGHGKKYDLLPLVFVVVSGHGKKYDVLPLFFGDCIGAWQEVRFVASSSVVVYGQKYDLLPLVFVVLWGMARSTNYRL